MQALHYIAPNQLEWRDVESPCIESNTDVLVRPTAVAACDLDRSIAGGRSPFPGPFILGHEFCGEVLQTGDAVQQLIPGDQVIASFQPSCGTCHYCNLGHSSVCSKVPHTSMYGIGAAGGDWAGAMAASIRVPWGNFNLRKIPDNISPVTIASGSDNLLDGLRAVDQPLAARPEARVLIAGTGSIPLYAVLCATHLGASQITFASQDRFALEVAEKLGAECLAVTNWPKRLGSHDITFDCTNSEAGLSAVIKSTAPYGYCTSASIYFSPTTPIPMLDMYMKGIQLNTGRVNSASQLDRMLKLVGDGLSPDDIAPAVVAMADALDAFSSTPASQKLILV